MGASLFTNASAQTALQTLSAASKSLSATQNRVSTGYRINTAEDNAAYWSIATTLRSDVKALGAVSDALGLGAATIDTVYTGINDTKDLLDQVKSKLVTASQSGVPRAQVQAEITQLQNRLKDVSKSTVINSESWLTQDSSAHGYNNVKNVVGSFTRTGGAISLDNIEIDISGTKLYENSTAINTAVDTAATTAATAYTATIVAGGANLTDAAWNTNAIAVDTALKASATIFPADSVHTGGANFAAGDTAATANTGYTAWKTAAAGVLVAGVTEAAIGTAVTTAFGANGAAIWGNVSSEARTTLVNSLKAAVTAYDAAATALPAAAGATITADEAAAANKIITDLNTAFTSAINTAVGTSARGAISASIADGARSVFESAMAGNADNDKLGIFDKVRTVVSNADGSGAKAVRVSDIDISKLTDTDFDKGVLTSYLKATDDALQELTLSASVVGAAKARIEGNKTFVKNLVDANNRGIGQLVDADLNEESAKLKALQTQEQLAIQALGIANSSSQNILRLFQ
ncbi:flagellin [Pseudochelatococcus sp. G4_1912]|uniref:flagellin N-terminal helical domain-containing protein n=1 Tax=Pseudochelatococcus sp. G4_1912 TaxID=3114288 RepID=UPI0039C6C473